MLSINMHGGHKMLQGGHGPPVPQSGYGPVTYTKICNTKNYDS